MLEKEERQKRVTISMHPILIGTLEPEDVFLSLFCTWKHAVGAPNDTITQHGGSAVWRSELKLQFYEIMRLTQLCAQPSGIETLQISS